VGTRVECSTCRNAHLMGLGKEPCKSCVLSGYLDYEPRDKPVAPSTPTSPSYYSRFKIQPLDFIAANKLDFLTGNIIKYVMRHDAKNGLEDLQKAKVYLERLIQQVKEKETNA